MTHLDLTPAVRNPTLYPCPNRHLECYDAVKQFPFPYIPLESSSESSDSIISPFSSVLSNSE